MTQSTGERIYRACTRCRHRKVKCDLKTIGESGKPPCVKRHNEGHSCTLAESRRGGDYSRHRVRRRAHPENLSWLAGHGSSRTTTAHNIKTSSNSSEAVGIQNPLEAIELLAKVASKKNETVFRGDDDAGAVFDDRRFENGQDGGVSGSSSEPILNATTRQPNGLELLDARALAQLIESYQDTYHAFLPIAPRHIFSTQSVTRTAREEPFILTAVLLIATKDKPKHASLHMQLWESMEKMLLQIVLGSMEVRTVGCVEGLLVLAEWVPHANTATTPMNVSQKGNGGLAGTEDTAAWTLVGLAVRQAYLLRLDKYAFRGEPSEESNEFLHRKRLAWTYTYIADRQISIRMGQAFWCRGPSLATKFTASDFPSLQPRNAYDDDYASVLQSQLELTVLFGNIHDLLYASKPRSISLMVAGDYTKYLDDSMQGLAAWKRSWAQIDVAQHLKLILELKYEYLRLYIHGFAFQAAIFRAPGTPPNHAGERTASGFPYGVLATPDGRHIHLAISAAKAVLLMLGDQINPTRHLRFLGPRFYLYAIHCAVFLFKATSYGAISTEEQKECTEIVRRYIHSLEMAASCEQHIAARHSALLASLWLGKRDTPGIVRSCSDPPLNEGYEAMQQPPPPMQGTSVLVSVDGPSNLQKTFTDSGLMYSPCESRESRYASMAPQSFVTGLYSMDQQMEDLDVLSMMDFGTYGEPDLRDLIAM